jgi:hypothetical protein
MNVCCWIENKEYFTGVERCASDDTSPPASLPEPCMIDLIKRHFSAAVLAVSTVIPTAAVAADGYWLDQYNALLFMGLLRLDPELTEMKQSGANTVMVHADSLPDPMLRWIAWRARRAGLQPVAWIQRPSPTNLKRVGALKSFRALQVDDHFFADPPVALADLKAGLASRQLWCSFQPGQYSWSAAQSCDHVDIQVYRQSCSSTVGSAYQLGVAGRQDTAIAVYHDGSAADDRRLACFRKELKGIGNRLFVFKWKNPEHWLSPITRGIWRTLSRLRSSAA